jgi:hypothetical protein
METLKKIMIVFQDIQSFTKMIEEEKYSFKYSERYQFGGACIEIFRDEVLIKDLPNLGNRANAKRTAYDFILDDFAERNKFKINDDMDNAGLHIKIGQAASGINFGIAPTEEEIERDKIRVKNANEFIENWNSMVDAVKKYNS